MPGSVYSWLGMCEVERTTSARAGFGLAFRMYRELPQRMGGARFFRCAVVSAIFPVDVFHGSCMISD